VRLRVPEGAATGPVILDTERGRYRGPRFRVTDAPPPPVIERIDPASGPPGTEVTIHGTHFSPQVAANDVRLGEAPVVVRSATPTELEVIVPAKAEDAPFRVAVGLAGVAESEPFDVVAPTAIERIEPSRAPPGSTVVVHGTGFSAKRRDNRVHLNGRRLRVRRASPTRLELRLPARGIRSGPLVVDVRGAGRDRSADPLVVQPRPRLIRVSPDRAPPGRTVTIHGAHFGDDRSVVQVRVGEHALQVQRVSPTAIEAEVPSGATSGDLEVQIHALTTRRSVPLTVLEPVQVEGFKPRSGPAGSRLTITGQGFSSRAADHRVTISGVVARVLRATRKALVVRVPRAESGPIRVAVEGSGAARTSQPFMITEPPVISSFSPRSGPPGTRVRIRGAHFGARPGLVSVELEGRPMKVEAIDDDLIVARVPSPASSGRIKVSVRLQGATQSRRPFRVTAQD
jgi:hypothetical protein